jgi:hypothetical protein
MNTQLAFVGRSINMAPRTHRRWLVVVIYLIFTALILAWAWFSRHGGSLAASGCMIVGIALCLLILYLAGAPRDATDEREKRRWDQVRARAYPWLGGVLLLAGFTWQLPAIVNATLHPELHGILQQLPYSILMAAGVLYLTLPQAILLWTEPDMDSGGPLA